MDATGGDILQRLIETSLVVAQAYALGFIRIMAILQIFPLFTTINLRGTVRAVLALVLTIPIAPGIEAELRAMPEAGALDIVLIAFKEFVVGTLIGALISIPFWGLQSAGDLVDVSRGASAANVADPVNANENSLTGQLLLYAALAIFVVTGGFLMVIELIYATYGVLRVTEMVPALGFDFVAALGNMLTRMFLLGLILSGPFMIALIVIDVGLVFGARLAPQLQVNDFAAILKNLATVAMIPLYVLFLQQYMVEDWSDLMQFVTDFLRAGSNGR